MVESLITTILSSAIIASVIGAIAWLGSRLSHRPSLWHVVWVLAIVKLFVPPIWTIPTGLSSGHVPFSVQHLSPSVNGTVQTSDIDRSIPGSVNETRSVSQAASLPPNSGPSPWNLPSVSWSFAILCFWCVGSLIGLIISSRRVIRFHALVRRGMPADDSTSSLIQTLIASLSPTVSPPRVRMIDDVIPPLLWPVGTTPTIVLPATWWQTTADDERRTVLMHELVHWRRGDHWVRLLQWFAGIVFWWHPLVWIARGELHRLEEQCCDAEVLHRLPGAGRSYATALVSASQWLGSATEIHPSRLSPSPLAIPMSESTQFESFHRRILMLPTLKHRPWTVQSMLILLLAAALPLSTGLSARGQQAATPEIASVADANQSATLSGLVTDTDSKPLADAKVRVVIPATDLRQFQMTSEYREVWGTTDESGKYSVTIPGIEKETTAAIDVLHPGHRRVGGAIMGGDGDPSDVTLNPGGHAEFDAKLPERLYFAGQVVDESGKPIEGVAVFASLSANNGVYGVEKTSTDAEGKFGIYCYDATWLKDSAKWQQPTAGIHFVNDEYILSSIDDLQDVEPSTRDSLKVVLKKGFSLAGRVLNSDKSPAGDLAITILQRPYQRKGMVTDANGMFRFDGVVGSSTQLRVVDVPGNSKLIQTIDVNESNLNMTVMLTPFESPLTTTHQVLGMTLVNLTDAINSAYDLQLGSPQGVMITNPGTRFREFEIGELKPGDVFWMVGMESVDNLQAFVGQLIQEAKSPTRPPAPGVNPSAYPGDDGEMYVRVVYLYNDDRGDGTNTQYMKLTPQDIAEFEKVLETLGETSGTGRDLGDETSGTGHLRSFPR